LGIAAMVLTIAQESEAAEKARMLIGRASQEVAALPVKQAIIDMVNTIMVYKFVNLSREEIDAMLGTKLEETRVVRDAQDEGAMRHARSLVLKLLTRKVGGISDHILNQLNLLSLEQLDTLGEALLEFDSITDLTNWLEERQ
jgi:predicted transposase YdaD